MIMLSPRVGESIHIGDDIIVRVVGNDRGQVQVAIEAPQDLKIWCTELLERIQNG